MKVSEELSVLLDKAGMSYRLPEVMTIRHLKKIRKRLYVQKQAEGIEFVHGTGKSKTPVQRAIETVDGWIEKNKHYTRAIHICGDTVRKREGLSLHVKCFYWSCLFSRYSSRHSRGEMPNRR